MKISLKTGIINSASFLILSVLTVVFFQISARNIIINSQVEDLKRTAEHFLLHEETAKEPPGKGKYYADEKRYALLSESIYIADISSNTKTIIQDPFSLSEKVVDTIFQSGEQVFMGMLFNYNDKSYLIASDITPEYRSIELFETTSVLFIIFTIIVSLILGIITTKISLNPWKKFLNIITKINTSDLSKRFKVKGHENEIRDMENSLNSMLERLEKGFELQKRFSSDVAHELRTPVTSIQGYAQMLKKWGLSDKNIAEESVNSIIETVNEMEDMIEKLLTMSRLESEAIKFKTINTSEWIVSLKKSLSRKYTNRIIFFENDGFYKSLHSSEKYLNILIGVFVDNAIKYSHQDEPITLLFKRNLILIKDNGIGIAQEDINNIFERFYQVEESRVRKVSKGFGIGLSIAKKISETLDVKITVKSKLSQGTQIKLEL